MGESSGTRTRIVCEGKALECWQTAEQGHLWLILGSSLTYIRYWV